MYTQIEHTIFYLSICQGDTSAAYVFSYRLSHYHDQRQSSGLLETSRPLFLVAPAPGKDKQNVSATIHV